MTLDEADKAVAATLEERDDALMYLTNLMETEAFELVEKVQDALGEDFSMLVFAMTELRVADKKYFDAIERRSRYKSWSGGKAVDWYSKQP
jgi:hypothetical protein